VLFIAVQIALDVSLGMFLTAGMKFGFGVFGAFVLNMLCGVQLGVVSWALVATPFIVTSLATAISMGLDADFRIVSTAQEHMANRSRAEKTQY